MLETCPDVCTIADVQSILQIGRTKAYKLVTSGQLRSIKIGSSIRIPKSALLEFIEKPRYNNGEVDRRCYQEGGCDEDNR